MPRSDLYLQLGFEELKKLALDDIERKLSNDNILVELFSTFSCRYVEKFSCS